MKCHYYTDKKTGERFFIPECWGSVIGGKEACTCNDVSHPESIEQICRSLQQEVKQLKKDVARLKARN